MSVMEIVALDIDIVAINKSGHVVALATSDRGDGDRTFARDYGRKFRIEMMPVSEACNRHLLYLDTLKVFRKQ